MSHTNSASASNHGAQWSHINNEWSSNKDMKRGSAWNTDEMKNEEMDSNETDNEDNQESKEWDKNMNY